MTNNIVLKQVHNNTHSVGRIIRNVELLIQRKDLNLSEIKKD